MMSTPLPVPDDKERAMNGSSSNGGGPPPPLQKERQEQQTTVIQMTIQPQSTGTTDTPAATLAATDSATAFPQALIDTAPPMEISSEEAEEVLGTEPGVRQGTEQGADSPRPRPAFSYRSESAQLQPSTSTAHSADTYEYSDEGELALERVLAAIGQPAEEAEPPAVDPLIAEPPVLDSVSMFHELELGFNLRRFEEGAQLPSDPPSVEYSENGATVQSELFELGQGGFAVQEPPPAVDAAVEVPEARVMRAAADLPIAEQPGPSRPRAHAVQLYPGGGDGEPQTCYLTHLPRLAFEPTFFDEAPMRDGPMPLQEHPVPLASQSADVLANLLGVPTDDEADMSPSYLNTPEDSMGVDKENQPDTISEALRSAAMAFAEFSTDDSQIAEVDAPVPVGMEPDKTAAATDAAEVDAPEPVGMKNEQTAAFSDAAEVDAPEPVGMKPDKIAAVSDAAEVDAPEPVGMKNEETAASSDAAEVGAPESVGMKNEQTAASSDAAEVDAPEPVGMKNELTAASSDAAEVGAPEPVGMKPDQTAAFSDAAEVDAPEPVGMKPDKIAAVSDAAEVDAPEPVGMKNEQTVAFSDAAKVDAPEPVGMKPDKIAAVSDAAEVDAPEPVGMKNEQTAAFSDAAEVDAPEPVGMKPDKIAAVSDAAEVDAPEPVGMKNEQTAAFSDAAEVDAPEPVGMKPEHTAGASDAAEVDAPEPVGMKPEHSVLASDAAEVDAPEPVDMKPEHSARGGTPALGEESGQIDAATTTVEAEVTMEVSLSDDEPLSNLLITGVAAAEPSPSKKSLKKLKRKRNAINKTEHVPKRTASKSQSATDEPTIAAQNIQLKAEAAIAPQNIPPTTVAATAAEAIEPQQSGSKKLKRKRSLPTLAPKTKQPKKIFPPEISTTTMVLRSKSHHS